MTIVPTAPYDVQCSGQANTTPFLSPALGAIRREMNAIKESERPGMIVIRWDGTAWNIHICEAPERQRD